MLEDNHSPSSIDDGAINSFISRWKNAGGTEKANYQLFLTELCALLGLPQPDPASEDTHENSYVFERRVNIDRPDGSHTHGFIDLYRRGCFVLEAKQTGKSLDTHGWDKAMLKAQTQADQYVRALPAKEGRPPFIVVTDVGRSLELYSEFSRSGGSYVPFPDPGHHRIRLEDLRDPAIQKRLYDLWHNPDALDVSKQAARVTREVSGKLAELAKSLEQKGYPVERVAHFLKRCLFTMFAEDVELLPRQSFTKLLEKLQDQPEHFPDAMNSLWETMNTGGYEGQLMTKIRRFNGGLFKGIEPIPLNKEQIGLLVEAARADWRYVEPAIFGTLLERALDPRERHKLGAHYTPRAYVERLVMPTLIEPLRDEWQTVQVAAEAWLQQDKDKQAIKELREFHHKLCNTRVLDPACGSGNFLYVALEHLKRLEGEVLNLIRDLSGGQASFDTEGLTVDPHQFLGLEINPRAAAIAEIVLWIGYLQWHYRINGELNLPEPILKDFHNIECRDALINYDARESMLDEAGDPITIWDGISYKKSPITGELISDDSQRIPVYFYINPTKAEWPEADFIVGNPPFIGASTMRRALGDGYVDAVRKVFKGEVPDSADFVMYWWHTAAEKVRNKHVQQFGFITTNSLRQTFNRRVIETHLNHKSKSLSLVFAIPDHPWVDGVNGAAVRIAMTVGSNGEKSGSLRTVIKESNVDDDARSVTLNEKRGKLFADLAIGVSVVKAVELKANSVLSHEGVKLHGSGFIISFAEALDLGLTEKTDLEKYIRPYLSGRDLAQKPRNLWVIDFYGLEVEEIKSRYPKVYQWILERIKPDRDAKAHTKDGAGYAKYWWRFGKPRQELRKALGSITKYMVTVKTAKHRLFQYIDEINIAESKLIAIATDDTSYLGQLSSRVHIIWSWANGSWQGAGNDSVYVKSRCFEAFPFPALSAAQSQYIGELAEKIDSHRKRQQAEHEKLTLTGMYNVLEKLRAGEMLTDKDKQTHEWGIVSVLREFHDELDQAVFEAYGWQDLAEVLVGRPGATTPLPDKPKDQAEAEEELLNRLVKLNHQRAVEEAQGHIRWLRPDYQAPESTQINADISAQQISKVVPGAVATTKAVWPKNLREQVQTIREHLAIAPQTAEELAAKFKRKPEKAVVQLLSALEVLGQASHSEGQWELIAP